MTFILKDELAKMTREINPAAWLKDAYAAIDVWCVKNPEYELSSVNSQLGLLINVMSHGRPEMLASYTLRGKRIEVEVLPKRSADRNGETKILTSEQQLIDHLVNLLRAEVQRFVVV